MRTKRVRASFALFALITEASSAVPAATPLQPTGKWALDYDTAQCVALREYGDPANPISFGIRSSPNGETYELIVGRKRYGPEFAEEDEGSVDFGQGPIKAWFLHYGSKTNRITLDKFRVTSTEMAQAKSSTFVVLHAKGSSDVAFRLSSMTALLKGLEDCTADLKRYWNDAGETGSPIAVQARGDVRKIFSDQDYPTEAINRRQTGTAQFLLLINEQGKVAACHVLKPSGVPVLDGMGCAVIQERAKFKPALDAKGQAVRSTYVTPPVKWMLAS